MTPEEIYKAATHLKALMVDRGYTSADVRIAFQYIGFPMVIIVEADRKTTNLFDGPPTSNGINSAIQRTEAWINQLPDAKKIAQQQFLAELEQLPVRAKELGIELPVRLVA